MVSMNSPRLYFPDVTGTRSIFPITQTVVKLGRNAENQVVLNDPSISRFHAEIRAMNGDFYVHDIGSKNGILVNGERVAERKLSHGDQIQLGSNPAQAVLFALSDLDEAAIDSLNRAREAIPSKVSSHHLRMLLEVSKALSSSLVLDDVLNRVIDAVMELTGADRGFLMLKDAKGELQFTMARNISHEALSGNQYRLSRSVIQRVIESEQSVIVCDSERDQNLRGQQSVIALNLKTIMCVPLRTYRADPAGRDTNPDSVPAASTIGLLYVDKRTVTHFFSDQDLELFESLAGHAAIAIENARLHQEEIAKLQLEEEFKIAREIQQTLLPRHAPELSRTQVAAVNIPCRAIGGDYYDFMPLGKNKMGIVIADVSGKGCSAALLTSMVQGIFLAEVSPDKTPAETVAQVNHHLVQKNLSGKFVTVFFGVLDDSGEFRYCNAGHNPPLLVTAQNGVQTLQEGGMVLGVFDGVPFQQGVVKWEAGDRLVLFTDGVTEAQSKTQEEFGEDRLLELVRVHDQGSAEEVKSCIIDSLMDFTAGMMQHDDITLIVAKRV